MRIRVLYTILFSILIMCSLSAQKSSKKITITGTVLDENGYPVVNAIVMVDGVKTSSLTDSKGVYKIKVKRTAEKVGIISFTSGLIEEVIDGRAVINFNYSTSSLSQKTDQAVSERNEGVNTGYNYVKEKNVTTPVRRINGNDRKYASYRTVSEMITREYAGVKYSGGGYVIQGSKDLFGPVTALLVVDGVYVDNFEGITPSVVESITILKGSAASIYGSRGYGGAIVITTKK
jgi:TonB-dependent SusC/RagA subfamily outer membrane receptor